METIDDVAHSLNAVQVRNVAVISIACSRPSICAGGSVQVLLQDIQQLED